MTKCLPHYQGAVVGAALGDALGFIVEKQPFAVTEQFVKNFRATKTYSPAQRTYPETYAFGQYSDDTQFSKLLILSLLKHRAFNSQDYFTDLLTDFKNDKLVGIGRNTRRIFKAALKNEDLSLLNKNSSNGSLMRTYPIGLFFNDDNSIMDAARAHSILTHDTDEAIKACQSLSLIIHYLKSHSLSSLSVNWSNFNLLNFDLGFLTSSKTDAQNYLHNLSPSPGWEFITPSAKATLGAVIYTLHNNLNRDFTTNILEAISLGGDTDSVASIVGMVVGYNYGVSSIPSHWNNLVHDRNNFQQDYLMNLGQSLFLNKL